MKKTIKLKKYVDIINEYIAGGAVSPGMHLDIAAAGTVSAGGAKGAVNFSKLVMLEDELQGKTVDDALATNDPVQCWATVSGEEALLKLKDGETVVIGDTVSAGAAGLFVKTLTELFPVGVVLEAAAPSGADGWVKVRII